MKIGLKCFLVAAVYFISPFQGKSQISIAKSIDTPNTFKLISPLDLIFNLPETKKEPNSIKQRSIFDANTLPIFCKIEHKLAKSSNVNLRMRLGSLDYVNKLEGKN